MCVRDTTSDRLCNDPSKDLPQFDAPSSFDPRNTHHHGCCCLYCCMCPLHALYILLLTPINLLSWARFEPRPRKRIPGMFRPRMKSKRCSEILPVHDMRAWTEPACTTVIDWSREACEPHVHTPCFHLSTTPPSSRVVPLSPGNPNCDRPLASRSTWISYPVPCPRRQPNCTWVRCITTITSNHEIRMDYRLGQLVSCELFELPGTGMKVVSIVGGAFGLAAQSLSPFASWESASASREGVAQACCF